jgi:hypothetical protein
MFDYQAGEKYKLTLIMVALAGIMAGMFFTVLLMPTPEPQRRGGRPAPAYMRDPDITGKRAVGNAEYSSPGAAQAMTPQAQPTQLANPLLAKSLVEQWLPLAWDLSAGSAKASQERAMLAMTSDCAEAYQKNIWTPDLAKQIDESGLQSAFKPDSISVGDPLADGAVVVYVSGTQTLNVPGKGSTARQVKLEYMVKMTSEGLRIAGISEGGKSM